MRTSRALMVAVASLVGAHLLTAQDQPALRARLVEIGGSGAQSKAGPACAGGQAYDDGLFDGGFALSGNDVRIVQQFLALPDDVLRRVCVCWFRLSGSTSISYEIVAYNSDGVAAGPGSLITSVPASVSGTSETPTFFGHDLGSVALPDGELYIGVRYAGPASGEHFVCMDEVSSFTPIYASVDGGATWSEVNGASQSDIAALGIRAELETPSSECVPSDTTLCLRDDRFKVEATWTTPDGGTGPARVVEITDETGYLWFFDPANVEAIVKVLDACVPAFNRYWVFAGGLTNVRVELRVTDTLRRQTKTYTNPQGRAFQPLQDTDAFATCP